MADAPTAKRSPDRKAPTAGDATAPSTGSARAVTGPPDLTRRRVLGICSTAAVAVLAGCADEAGEPTEGDRGGAGDEDGGEDGGDRAGGEAGGSGGGSDGAATEAAGDTAGEGTDDRGTNGGTGAGTATEGSSGEPTDPGAETTETPTQTATATEPTEGQPELSVAAEFTNSFGMEMTWRGEQRIDMNGRFHEGNLYWRWQVDGEDVEWYLVNDSSYVVSQGQCLSGTVNIEFDAEDVDPNTFKQQADENPEVRAAGTDEIDGETVYVYEFEDESVQGTYYILVDSGYLRRVETDQGTWNFHSWGKARPVEKPDMDCQDPSSR
jgi:hypothetical protein